MTEILELAPTGDQFERIIMELGEEIKLGRHHSYPTCCQFKENKISTQHCRIFQQGTEFFVEDTSTNGTFINGVKIGKGNPPAKLKHGDYLSLVIDVHDHKLVNLYPCWIVQVLQENTPTFSSTLEFIDEDSKKRSIDDVTDDPSAKKQKIEVDAIQEDTNSESIEDNLVCSICSELYYKCVTCIPCLHNFCAPCLSEWKKQSDKCPQCRGTVASFGKNHTVENLVTIYLKQHPEKARSPDELEELEKKNSITDESLRLGASGPAPLLNVDMSEDYIDDEYENGDSLDLRRFRRNVVLFRTNLSSGGESPIGLFPMGFGTGFGIGFGQQVGFNQQCRECQQPGPDGYTCGNTPNHVNCNACRQLIPDRDTIQGRETKCEYCDGSFCELYFGAPCGRDTGRFCQLKNHKLDILPIEGFGGNQAEREILLNYMSAKGLSTNAIFHKIVSGIENSQFVCRMKDFIHSRG